MGDIIITTFYLWGISSTLRPDSLTKAADLISGRAGNEASNLALEPMISTLITLIK